MPLQLTAGDRKILLIAAAVFVVLLGGTSLFVRGGGSREEVPSTYSTASGGAKAAFLLLKESGYTISTWEYPLRQLKGDKGKILILADPATGAATEDRQGLEGFLKRGGRVIATGPFSSFYLPTSEAIPDPIAGMTWKRLRALSPSGLSRAAPEITLAPQAYWHPSTGVVALYGDAEKPAVVKYKVGDGEVLWLAAATPLTNAGLREPGNLEFLLAAVGGPGQNEILWDEFVHGYQRAAATTASSRIIPWIELQFALFALVILLTFSRRSGPVWIPAAETRLSPLEFVHTLGSVYQRAGVGGVAVDICYQRFRYLLTRRLGLSANASVDDLNRAVRERWPLPEKDQHADFAETLRECEVCRYDPNVRPETALNLVQKIFDYTRRLRIGETRH